MSSPVAIDANVIVRYLTGDDPRQSPKATDLFRAASEGNVQLVVPTTVIQEAVYALETFYAATPQAIAPKLISLISLPNVTTPDAKWLAAGIQWYGARNADFGDALLCAYAAHHGCSVATFDRGIAKKFTEIPIKYPA